VDLKSYAIFDLDEHPHFQPINNDPRYRHLKNVPMGECQKRIMEVCKTRIQEIGKNLEPLDFQYSLLVAHANTLRALVMHLDRIDPEDIESLNVPTAIPFFYEIDVSTGDVITNKTAGTFRGIFITDERMQRSFLERRRAANDPWMWALHDDQVATSMLSDFGNDETKDQVKDLNADGTSSMSKEGLKVAGLEAEARKNTELFAPEQSSIRDA
jgi:hypothetical protein